MEKLNGEIGRQAKTVGRMKLSGINYGRRNNMAELIVILSFLVINWLGWWLIKNDKI